MRNRFRDGRPTITRLGPVKKGNETSRNMRAEFFMQSHKWNPRHGRYALRKHLPRCGRLASAPTAPLAPSLSRSLCIYEGTLVVVHWLHVPLRKCAVWIPPTAALQRCILWAGCARHGTATIPPRSRRKSIPGSWIKVGRDREESLSLRLFSRLIGHVALQPFESLSSILGCGAPVFRIEPAERLPARVNAAPRCITFRREGFRKVGGFLECLWNVYCIQQVDPHWK